MDRIKMLLLEFPREGFLFRLGEKLSDYRRERRRFRHACGYELSLKNPQSYNEKIVWKKLYDRNPLLPVVADKYRVRAYLRNILGAEAAEEILVPLLYVTDDPETIPFDSLPEEYIIKPNHASGRCIVVEKTSVIDRPKIMAQCKEWLRQSYGIKLHEWAYQGIRRKILIEKLLRDENGQIPINYKFCVIHEKCHLIQAIGGRAPEERIGYYSPEWHRLNMTGRMKAAGDIKKPEGLEAMLRLAERLGAYFDCVRVDLYFVDKRIYFSELTNYDGSGRNLWAPRKYDYDMGAKWNLVPGYWKKDQYRDVLQKIGKNF